MKYFQVLLYMVLVSSYIACGDSSSESTSAQTITSQPVEKELDKPSEEAPRAMEAKQTEPSPTAADVKQKASTAANQPSKPSAPKTRATPTGNIKIVEAPPQPKEETPAPTLNPEAADLVEVPASQTGPTEKIIIQAPEKGKPKVEETEKQVPQPKTLNHDKWDQLLRKYVSATGKVNYKGIKGDAAALEEYLQMLAENPVQSDWPRNKKMAYWINAYNAFTVKLIVDNYPVSSITKLHGGKPWDVKWITLGNKTYSLNNIEHDLLRPQFKDARIHFAVNCAAKSCPPLLNRAWTESNLNSTLDQQAKSFINSSSYNSISANSAQISKIFEWYAEDFGDIISYLNKYAATQIDQKAKVSYRDYDWALNE